MKRTTAVLAAIAFGMTFLLSGCDFLTNIMQGGTQQEGNNNGNNSGQSGTGENQNGNENNNSQDSENNGSNASGTDENENTSFDFDSVLREINACFADANGLTVCGIEAVKSDNSVSLEISDDARITIGGFSNENGQQISHVDVRQYFETKNCFVNSLSAAAEKYPDVLTDEIVALIEEHLHYDYENDTSSKTFYIRMSDVNEIAKVLNPKYTKIRRYSGGGPVMGTEKSPAFGDGTIAFEPIIQDVKMQYLFDGREKCQDGAECWIENRVYMAVVFEDSVNDIVIDFENKRSLMFSPLRFKRYWHSTEDDAGEARYYNWLEGGFLAKNLEAKISMENIENAILDGDILLSEIFPCRSLVDVMAEATNLPELNVGKISPRLYDVGEDLAFTPNYFLYDNVYNLIVNHYHRKGYHPKYIIDDFNDSDGTIRFEYSGWKDKKNFAASTFVDAMLIDGYEALDGGHMFDEDNQCNPNALKIEECFADICLRQRGCLANVEVVPCGDKKYEWSCRSYGTIVNVQFDTDMSSITDGDLTAYGVVKFNDLPPKKLNPDAKAKIVLIKDGDLTSWENVFDLDVSNLSGDSDTPTNMERYRDSIAGALFVKQAYIDLQPNGLYARTINIGNDFYKTANNSNNSDVSRDYTNVSREKYGRVKSVDVNASLDLLELRPRTHLKYDATSPTQTLSHLNNIKLTPVQKLLLDDQHIYG